MIKASPFYIILSLSVILGAFFWFYPSKKKDTPQEKTDSHFHEENLIKISDKQMGNLGITVSEVGPGTLDIFLSTRGKIILHPDHLVHVLPKVSGVAKEAKKNVGDIVKQNEILAILESREMADIKATYLASLEKQKLAQSLYDREAILREKKVSAGQDFINACSACEEGRIQVQLSKQKLRAFGLDDKEINSFANQPEPDLRLYEIRSPMDGQIINRHITKGEFIENTSTIYEIANLSNVWVEIGVYPRDLYKVNEGQVVEITLPLEEFTTQAKIIFVSPIIQDETITSKAIAQLDNSEKKWHPGSFVKVNISTEKAVSPLVISKEAIQNMEGTDVVFVKVADGFEKRAIQTGKSDDKHIEVLSGLYAGEIIADSKTFVLKAELGKSSVEDDD